MVTMDDKPKTELDILENHEARIGKLEQANVKTEATLEKINETMKETQIRSSIKSDLILKQNESLIAQNERADKQLEDIFNSVMITREKEAVRNHEIKKIKTDNKLKYATLVIGAGGSGYLIIEALIRVIGGM